MKKKIFINLPVADPAESKEFFSALGFTFNPRFTDENAACMVISEDIFVMLLATVFFRTFTKKQIADAKSMTEVILALAVDSKEEVAALCNTAFGSGAKKYKEPKDHGFMYEWGFEDPDGHIWEVFWMEPEQAGKDGGDSQPVSSGSA